MLPQEKSYPPIGSKWRDADRRAKRTIQVVRLDAESKRVRIHCIGVADLATLPAQDYDEHTTCRRPESRERAAQRNPATAF